MAESTHRAEVVPVVLEPHSNADSLSIVKIYDGGYQVVVRTADWIGKDRGVYIQPDSMVPNTPEYAFLEGRLRIKARKLRGEWSIGLLVPCPEGAEIGDDLALWMGIEHYEPPEPSESTGGECEKAPRVRKVYRSSRATLEADKARLLAEGFIVGDPTHESEDGSIIILPLRDGSDRLAVKAFFPCYDVESFRKYAKRAFEPGEKIWITEKLHGANGRWVFDGERIFAGSRVQWKRQDENNLWWKALAKYPQMEEFLRQNPFVALYGEVYGQVQDLKYGTKPGEIRIAVFDILREGKWVDAVEAWEIGQKHNLPWVPLLNGATSFTIPDIDDFPAFDFEWLLELAEGPSQVEGANHVREGIVIKPLIERWDAKIKGRVCLKIVANGYMERA